MADIRRFAAWDPGVIRAVRVTGDGTSAGSAYDLTVKAGGTSVMRYVVQDFEPPRRVFLVAKTTFFTSEDEIRVEPDGSGSIVTYDATLRLNGPLAFFDPLLRVAFRRIGDRATAGLQRALSGEQVAA
jgi:carbon monoxide dehydrogenase subunit G